VRAAWDDPPVTSPDAPIGAELSATPGARARTGRWRLRHREVLVAWALGVVGAVLATTVLVAVVTASDPGFVAGDGFVARDAALAGMWTGILGIVPAVVIGLPVWFGLAWLLRSQPRQWLHVLWFAVVGLVLGTVISAALFGQVVTGGLLDSPGRPLGGEVGSLLRTALLLGAPWGIGAAVGRAAVVPLVRRRLATSPATMSA
jgi:uncharacterized BrkB/YihY/UPF0761 family membrane protein